MKKAMIAMLCLVPILFATNGMSEGVPRDVLHEAIMTMTWEDSNGECWVEGHFVLGQEETQDTAIVYAEVSCMNYGFLAGIFTDTGGGFVMPVKMVFEKTAGEYSLREIQEPKDGTEYWPSLQAMMPETCLNQIANNEAVYRADIDLQMREQAEAYLDSIGRDESVGNWRDLGLQTPDILGVAATMTSAFSSYYPGWVTECELVEDGERFIYKSAWVPDSASAATYEYPQADGNVLICDGRTGMEILTKTRRTDGVIAETITIRAELYDLYVTYEDAYGSKEYHFIFDGWTYHQPTIREEGECRVEYPAFDIHCAALPQ